MSYPYKTPVAILGRLLLAAIFLLSPFVNLIPNFGSTVETMRHVGVPAPGLALPLAIGMLLVGSASLIVGYRARWGALLLLLFLLAATFYFHVPWQAANAAEASAQAIHFLKNIGLMGALLLVIVLGPGPGSLDGARE
jgi:putative oxidoreductase